MIETWAKNGWQKIGQPIARRLSFLPVGGRIALLVMVAVGGRLLWAKNQASQRDGIAIAFGRARLPSGTPQISHDGRQITTVEIGEKGLGVFLQNRANGQSLLVHQKGANQDLFLNLRVWPWSPDDRHFAYSAEALTICDASGKPVATLPTEGQNNVASLAWLSSDQFVYVNRQGLLHWIQNRNGQWLQLPVLAGKKIGTQYLTALSKDTIAWQKGNRIWFLDLARNLSGILFELKEGTLNDFDYSPTSGQLLLSSSQNGRDFLWKINAMNHPASDLVVLADGPSIHDARWLDAEKGACAFLSTDPYQAGHNFLMIKPDIGSEPLSVEGLDNVSAFSVSSGDRQLLLVGIVSNELAAGVWSYDLATKALQPVVPCTDRPSPYAKNVRPMHGKLQVAGSSLDYYVYPPANFDRHARKKYPVVIGNTLYHAVDPVYQNRMEGPLWAPALARCGAYVVIVERPGFWFNHIDQWPENIMAAYQTLVQDPTVDAHQVFLFATSAETQYLSQLIEKHPDLWAGLLVLNGGAPQLSDFPVGENAPRMLLTAGEFEQRENHLKRYQADALRQGMAVEYVLHPASAHVLMGKEPLTQKNEAMTRFIFNE